MTSKIKIVIAGQSGRMSQSILRCAHDDDKFVVTDDYDAADVFIDFTHGIALEPHLNLCLKHNMALVVGTTGLDDTHYKMMSKAAERVAILQSANTSIGVTVLEKITEQLAKILDSSFDIEITETHHRYKKDAPSGTALMLGRAAARGRGVDFDDVQNSARSGVDMERAPNEIGLSAIRGGSVVGDHTVLYLNDFEQIEITHKALDRDVFAQGALKAAHWIARKPAGLHTMTDLCGFEY